MLKSGIYKITNMISGKIYIGSGVDINRRWREHKSDLNLNRHRNDKLQKSWNKHGEINFKFEVVEYCLKDLLLSREQFWFEWTRCHDRHIGYNLAKIAGSNIGYRHSDKTKKKISEAKRIVTLETRELLRKSNLGKRLTEETKFKMSLARKGKKLSSETIAKMKLAKQNMTTETKAKMSAWQIGRKIPEATLVKARNRKHSPETLAKMSVSIKAALAAKKILFGGG